MDGIKNRLGNRPSLAVSLSLPASGPLVTPASLTMSLPSSAVLSSSVTGQPPFTASLPVSMPVSLPDSSIPMDADITAVSPAPVVLPTSSSGIPPPASALSTALPCVASPFIPSSPSVSRTAPASFGACHVPVLPLPQTSNADMTVSWSDCDLSAHLFEPSTESMSTNSPQVPTNSFVQGPLNISFQGPTSSSAQGPSSSSAQGPTGSSPQVPTSSFVQGPLNISFQGLPSSSALGPTSSLAKGTTSSSPGVPTSTSVQGPLGIVVQGPTSIQGPSNSLGQGPSATCSSPAQEFTFKDLDCLDNLPEVVESLSQAQRQQAAEIKRQFQFLQEEKELLKEEQDRLQEVQGELRSCTRQICLAEEEGAVVAQHVKRLQNDLESTSSECLQVARWIQETRQKKERDARLFAQYRLKMTTHQELVHDQESGTQAHVDLAKQKEKIQALRSEKTAVEDGLLVTDSGSTLTLEQKMASLEASKEELIAGINSETIKIASEESRQACLRLDTEVLHKRNQAQLTRLKRQLKEAQLRNKQWHEEACQLESQIERLRAFTEE